MADRTPEQASATRVLVLNHRRDSLDPVLEALRTAGFDPRVSASLQETGRSWTGHGRTETEQIRVIVLNPLALQPHGVEIEMLRSIQQDADPIPVLILIEDPASLRLARSLGLPLCDFLVKPHSVEELVHRIDLAVQNVTALHQLRQRTRDLEGLISEDFKTGLLSDRHFSKLFRTEFDRAQRHHLPLSLALLDVDNFKGINDTTEYAFGDEVLRGVAKILKDSTRGHDIAARFGGDEFVLLLPHTTQSQAVDTALRITKTIAATVFRSGSYQRQVTISVGIDSYDGRGAMTPDALRSRANQALKEAKRRGKNKVWLFSECPGEQGES